MLGLQSKRIDAFAAHPGTAHTAIWDKMDKNKVEGVAFDLTAKVHLFAGQDAFSLS